MYSLSTSAVLTDQSFFHYLRNPM